MDTIKNNRYKILKNFLNKFELDLFKQYCRIQLINTSYNNISWPLTKEDEKKIEPSNRFKITHKYDVVMESLLECKKEFIEKATGLKLFSSYSLWRPYQIASDVAKSKRDGAKEISVFLNIETDGETWPIILDGKTVNFDEGDACIFLDECDPYREEFKGNYTSQVELYYVDQDGPFKDCKFNKRQYIGCQYEDTKK
tara:strand:+ start:549 stop:1139 length:591 start_codon:yes stop_codon:yes gene_type:complete